MQNKKNKQIKKTRLQLLQEVAIRDVLVFCILVISSSVVMGSFLVAMLPQAVETTPPPVAEEPVEQPEGRVEAGEMTVVYDCANPHPDWLFCEDWESNTRVDVDCIAHAYSHSAGNS